jgi:hypothetical protein
MGAVKWPISAIFRDGRARIFLVSAPNFLRGLEDTGEGIPSIEPVRLNLWVHPSGQP